jgi:hypothetical protein
MTKYAFFLVFAASIGYAQENSEIPSPDIPGMEGYLQQCMQTFEEIDKRTASKVLIDRAYILWVGNTYEIWFTRGEFGTFGDRSADFRLIFSCGVEQNNPEKIIYLQRPGTYSFINRHRMNSVTDKDRFGAPDVLFLRNGEKFVFSEIMKNNRYQTTIKYRNLQESLERESGFHSTD